METPFTGNENHDITLEEASAMTKNYRDANPDPTQELIISHFFGKDAIADIMDQTESVGIRLYYGLDTTGKKQLIICGVKENGDDLYLGKLAERSYSCPPRCSAANPLNSDTTGNTV